MRRSSSHGYRWAQPKKNGASKRIRRIYDNSEEDKHLEGKQSKKKLRNNRWRGRRENMTKGRK